MRNRKKKRILSDAEIEVLLNTKKGSSLQNFLIVALGTGMRPKTLQKILGHRSLQMTMDLYCHVEPNTLKEEMALMGEVV